MAIPLHRNLVALLAGGAPERLRAKAAKRLLVTIKPPDEVGRLPRRLCHAMAATAQVATVRYRRLQ